MSEGTMIDSSPSPRSWTFAWRPFSLTLVALIGVTLLPYGLYVGPVCAWVCGAAGVLWRRSWGLSVVAAATLYVATMALIAVAVLNATVSSGG